MDKKYSNDNKDFVVYGQFSFDVQGGDDCTNK